MLEQCSQVRFLGSMHKNIVNECTRLQNRVFSQHLTLYLRWNQAIEPNVWKSPPAYRPEGSQNRMCPVCAQLLGFWMVGDGGLTLLLRSGYNCTCTLKVVTGIENWSWRQLNWWGEAEMSSPFGMRYKLYNARYKQVNQQSHVFGW